jgi:tetratricopeptide (TPR) repeat protein
MEKSYAAYLEATRLAPDDVSIVNDTALIAVYHLYRDIDRAAELLEHCVEVGAEQLESDALDEKARWSLQNAWGDAHQNLGILYFHHKNDPETARAWFEKSIAIGPEPRPLVTEVYLKLIDEEAGFDPPPYVTDFLAWGRPCAE